MCIQALRGAEAPQRQDLGWGMGGLLRFRFSETPLAAAWTGLQGSQGGRGQGQAELPEILSRCLWLRLEKGSQGSQGSQMSSGGGWAGGEQGDGPSYLGGEGPG